MISLTQMQAKFICGTKLKIKMKIKETEMLNIYLRPYRDSFCKTLL